MILKFFTEDGIGGLYNEDGSEAMGRDEEVDNPYRTQTLTSLQQWRTYQLIYHPGANDPEKVDVVMAELESNIARSRKTYNVYSNEQKALFLYLIKVKFLKAKPATEQAGINPITAQDWIQRMDKDPECNIYEKFTNKINRAESELQEEHKHF